MPPEVARGLHMYRTLSFALAAAIAVTAIAMPGRSAAAPTDTLRWGVCPEEVKSDRLECATLDVPLDYRDPGGRQIEIAISRLASANPAQRRGVLLTNPGGPGHSGLDYPATLADSGLSQSVLDTFDVIGMAPRGVG